MRRRPRGAWRSGLSGRQGDGHHALDARRAGRGGAGGRRHRGRRDRPPGRCGRPSIRVARRRRVTRGVGAPPSAGVGGTSVGRRARRPAGIRPHRDRHPPPGEHPARGAGRSAVRLGRRGVAAGGLRGLSRRVAYVRRAQPGRPHMARGADAHSGDRCAAGGPGRAAHPERGHDRSSLRRAIVAVTGAAHHRGRRARRPVAGRAPRGARACRPRGRPGRGNRRPRRSSHRAAERATLGTRHAPVRGPSGPAPGARWSHAMGVLGRRRGAPRRPDQRHPHGGRRAHTAPGGRRVRARHGWHRRGRPACDA